MQSTSLPPWRCSWPRRRRGLTWLRCASGGVLNGRSVLRQGCPPIYSLLIPKVGLWTGEQFGNDSILDLLTHVVIDGLSLECGRALDHRRQPLGLSLGHLPAKGRHRMSLGFEFGNAQRPRDGGNRAKGRIVRLARQKPLNGAHANARPTCHLGVGHAQFQASSFKITTD